MPAPIFLSLLLLLLLLLRLLLPLPAGVCNYYAAFNSFSSAGMLSTPLGRQVRRWQQPVYYLWSCGLLGAAPMHHVTTIIVCLQLAIDRFSRSLNSTPRHFVQATRCASL
jgi:hypothetical protein